MNYVSVEELELLSFFEVEPSRFDHDISWPYNEFTYEVALDQYAISFTIYPAGKEVSLSVVLGGVQLYGFRGRYVEDVRYHKDADVETLQVVVSDNDCIWLRLRPNLLITQDAGGA